MGLEHPPLWRRLASLLGSSFDSHGCRLMMGAAALLTLLLGTSLVFLAGERPVLAVIALIVVAVGALASMVALPRAWRSIRALDLAMSGAHDGLFEWDPRSKRLDVSDRLRSMLGYGRGFLHSSDTWLDLVHPDDRQKYNRAVARHLKGETDHFYCEYRVRAHTGDYRWLAARGLAERNRHGRATLMAGSVADITDRVEHEHRARELALKDQLTGLPNRRSLLERLPAAIAEARRSHGLVAIMFIDLDRFKLVNDAYGHHLGDLLLVAIAHRLPSALRAYDALVRQGGDEMTVLLAGLSDVTEARSVAERLLELIAEPAMIDGNEIRVTASIGIALFPRDGEEADTLLRSADLAMYEAKAQGGNNLRFFEPRMREQASGRIKLESRLRVAIENGDLTLHYQPQRRFADGTLYGAEALVRWQDGDRLVRPDHFIPLAEEIGLIEPLGRWVMHEATHQMAAWHGSLPPDFLLSINLSPRQFLRDTVSRDLFAACADTGLSPEQICLEVTESVLLHPETSAVRTLNDLHASGFKIALDDFGTGYSSLAYLQLLDIDCLKIDKSFIANLDLALTARGARNGAAIVSAMIALAHRLGYDVVAEGVESADQSEWLRTLGCDYCQGYYYAPPLAAAEFARQILSAQSRPTI
ncbi:MAG: putative bifunctional diguanylate cyclase/phosphodiesterase [Rhodocyclaceae bacterium]